MIKKVLKQLFAPLIREVIKEEETKFKEDFFKELFLRLIQDQDL